MPELELGVGRRKVLQETQAGQEQASYISTLPFPALVWLTLTHNISPCSPFFAFPFTLKYKQVECYASLIHVHVKYRRLQLKTLQILHTIVICSMVKVDSLYCKNFNSFLPFYFCRVQFS